MDIGSSTHKHAVFANYWRRGLAKLKYLHGGSNISSNMFDLVQAECKDSLLV